MSAWQPAPARHIAASKWRHFRGFARCLSGMGRSLDCCDFLGVTFRRATLATIQAAWHLSVADYRLFPISGVKAPPPMFSTNPFVASYDRRHETRLPGAHARRKSHSRCMVQFVCVYQIHRCHKPLLSKHSGDDATAMPQALYKWSLTGEGSWLYDVARKLNTMAELLSLRRSGPPGGIARMEYCCPQCSAVVRIPILTSLLADQQRT